MLWWNTCYVFTILSSELMLFMNVTMFSVSKTHSLVVKYSRTSAPFKAFWWRRTILEKNIHELLHEWKRGPTWDDLRFHSHLCLASPWLLALEAEDQIEKKELHSILSIHEEVVKKSIGKNVYDNIICISFSQLELMVRLFTCSCPSQHGSSPHWCSWDRDCRRIGPNDLSERINPWQLVVKWNTLNFW